MINQAASYHGYRFPPEIISHAVWLYHRFCFSVRDTEDLLAQRGITVSYEAIRQWCRTFGPAYARILRRRQGRLGDTWHMDELFVNIQGRPQYLWRAVDQDGDGIDILVQPRRNRHAAERFFRKLLKRQGRVPRRLITDKLRSYRRPTASSCPLSCTARRSTRTIEPKSLINPPANASARCGGSNPPLTRNASCRYTASFGISFAWAAAWSGLLTTVG